MIHRRWSNGEWSVEILARANRNTVLLRRNGEIRLSQDFEYWETPQAEKFARDLAEMGKMKEEAIIGR